MAMELSPAEVQRLKAGIATALASHRLNAWQQNFLRDIGERLERYGPRTRLSDKQIGKLREVIGGEPLTLPSSATPSSFSERAPISRRHRPHQSQWLGRKAKRTLARRARWWGRKAAFNLAVFALLIGGGLLYSLVQPRTPGVSDAASSLVQTLRYEFSVTDGDTVRVRGEAAGTRLVGFNTPETYEPRCEQELALGNRAKARLQELVADGVAELVKVRCACAEGTEGTDACNFGRSCGVLRVNGRDVGKVLISEGLAVPFVCGSRSCPPLPRPWCAS